MADEIAISQSILLSIKKLLMIDADYKHFDEDIKMYINAAFSTLNELGVGPEEGFTIEDDTAKWSDFMPETKKYEDVKMYIFHKTKLQFDPPQMGYLVDAITKHISELEWRLNVKAEGGVR